MRLQLATPDDCSAGVQNSVAGLGLGGAWIVSGSSATPVSTKVGVGVHLESLDDFGVQHDSLRPCSLEVHEQVGYRVPL